MRQHSKMAIVNIQKDLQASCSRLTSPSVPPTTQHAGDTWLNESAAPALQVVSTVLPEEPNYVLNPKHPNFSKIKIEAAWLFVFDRRLMSKVYSTFGGVRVYSRPQCPSVQPAQARTPPNHSATHGSHWTMIEKLFCRKLCCSKLASVWSSRIQRPTINSTRHPQPLNNQQTTNNKQLFHTSSLKEFPHRTAQ